MLHRALRAWGSPGETVRVTAAEDTVTAPPIRPPQLLYAGDVNGEAVVLLHDGERLVRYAEPATDGGAAGREDTAALDFARTDNAGVTTAAAVVISRTAGGARYLMAPWIAETGTRDLLRPGAATRRLPAVDGVTAVVPSPATGGACTSWPVLSLRSSERIVEKHAFLLTDLGDLTPAHLTHTPPPGSGAPARQPREATGREALVSWARSACTLTAMRGQGARAVNDWVYARQTLPGGGRAAWVCTRMEAWRGTGRVQVRFQPPAAGPATPGTVVAEQGGTAACGRFGQHVVAAAQWRSPQGRWFVLAAGSRSVSRISLSGGVDASSAGPTIAVPAAEGTQVEVTAFHADGSELSPLRGR
ncbi:hypothetical protein [Streptomyces enissocaesilis]|uniref:Uncharacterized protein n=1 Tax=Streptomyces enissocaesilis TaxID=332589 RepID=A0ABN3X9Z5_9ACTN